MTTVSFDKAFTRTVGIEGKYSNDPNDKGGETMYGISTRVARANGYYGPMRDMNVSTARFIYKVAYWDIMILDRVAELLEPAALELFDTGVNMGVGVAGTFFQRVLNVLNRQGKDYSDISVDGFIGRVTLAALAEYLQHRGQAGGVVLLTTLNALQGARYIEIAEKDPTQEKFLYGWVANRVSL